MSRDNHLRSRSRSISRFRNYNNISKSQRSPPPPSSSTYRYQRNDQSPPAKRSRYQRERSRSNERNGERSRRPPSPTDIRRKNPDPSKVLGVFNLHVRTSETEIRDVFERFGPIDEIIMVKDAKTRGFRGYCFIYYNKQRDATAALNSCNGIELKERIIRVDYSLSERPHISTPGEYRGRRGRNNIRGGNSFSRPRHYSPMRSERTRYYDRHDNDRRNRSTERTMRRLSPPRDEYNARSEHQDRRRERSRDFDRHHRRASRERH